MERNLSIDYLKFLGLIGLLIAHISTEPILLLVRSFDVNLLVILSAFLATRSLRSDVCLKEYWIYVKKRFFRLVVPTWIFLTLYFVINLYVNFSDYSLKNVLRSYLLQDNSIGYVWIIYVYLICAILMPLIVKICQYKFVNIVVWGVAVVYFFLAENYPNYYFKVLVLYPIVYGLISYVAVKWNYCSVRYRGAFIVICFVFFVYKVVTHYFETGFVVSLMEYKYPPKILYLSYTVPMSFVLIELANKIHFSKGVVSQFVSFLSKNSLWFYLWHILNLQISKILFESECLRFIFVFVCTSIVVYVQMSVVRKYESKNLMMNVVKFFKG